MDFMKSQIITALIIPFIITGCSNEDEAPSLSTESVFSCNDYNQNKALRNSQVESSIRKTFLSQMKVDYKGTSEIEKFFRGFVSKDVDYAFNFISKFDSICLKNPRNGVNEASVIALNEFYNESMSNPFWTTCSTYSKGKITIDDIYNETIHPSTKQVSGNSGRKAVRSIFDLDGYGKAYIKSELDKACTASPNMRLWSATRKIVYPVIDEVNKAYYKKLADEKEQKRINDRNSLFEKYSGSLYKTGINNCENFRDLLYRAANKTENGYFIEPLLLTINDIPISSKEYIANVVKAEKEKDVMGFASEIGRNCSSEDSIETALMKTHFIKNAKTPYITELESIVTLKKNEDDCNGRLHSCIGARKYHAAKMAFETGISCELRSNTTSQKCFSEPSTAYEYHFILTQSQFIKNQISGLNKDLTQAPTEHSLRMEGYHDECQRRLRKEGLKGDVYESKRKKVCPSEGLKIYQAPIKSKIYDLESKLSKLNTKLIDISQLESMPPEK